MALFKINNQKLAEVQEKKIELEKHIQKLTEDNLAEVFGLEFVATEFEHNGLRLDTVAFDTTANAFVIIEYKRDKSFSVVDQGYSYLALLLNNKAEFVLAYSQKLGKLVATSDIDWSQSRVIFVAQSFTTHQQQAINFRDMPIELWQVKMYANDTVLYNQLKAHESSESIKTITKDTNIQKVSSQLKVYEVNDHFGPSKEEAFALYEYLRDKLTTFEPSIHENPRRHYIGFSLKENGLDTLVYVHPQTHGLRLDVPRTRPETVNDPMTKLSYIKGSLEHYNSPVSTVTVKTEDDVEYAIGLLKQVRANSFK